MTAETSFLGWRRFTVVGRLPTISIALVMLISAVFWGWQWQDRSRINEAAQDYLASGLYALEAENYFSHLVQTRQQEKSALLEGLHQQGKQHEVALAIVCDRDFAYFMDSTDSDFWGDSVFPQWRTLHNALNDKTRHFSQFKWGLSGADKRSLTFFTHGFLSLNAWQWGISVFSLLLFGIWVEPRVGGLSLLIVFVGGVVLTGFCGLMGTWHSATPLVGAGGGIGVIFGVYLFLFGRKRRNFIFHLTWRQQRRRWVIPLLGAYLCIPWATWLITARLLWEVPPLPAVIGLMLGLLCGWGLEKRVHAVPVSVAPARPTDERYREQFDKALATLSNFDFRGAEDAFSALHDLYPDRGDVAERLFMLKNYRPLQADFEIWTENLLEKISHDLHNIANIEHIVSLHSQRANVNPLSPTLMERLLINASLSNHLDFACELARMGTRQHLNSALFIKGLRGLAAKLQACDEKQALQFEQMANDLTQAHATA